MKTSHMYEKAVNQKKYANKLVSCQRTGSGVIAKPKGRGWHEEKVHLKEMKTEGLNYLLSVATNLHTLFYPQIQTN